MANEKRLIDANELLKDAEDYSPISAGLADMYDVKWLVDAQPTVDAVEVVHGRWIDVALRFTQVKEKCSVCGGIVYAHGFNYCPNCGANMDGERKDDNA